ncbi:MAG TPA: hypothetical protein VF698_18490 [Thermoanaerobaculia bacterium]
MMLVAALAFTLNLKAPFQHAAPAPTATCNIRTVSYRFVGEAGTEFHYEGDRYVVPAGGTIELLASPRHIEYQVAGRKLPLNVWPIDEFGTRTVPLPTRTNF